MFHRFAAASAIAAVVIAGGALMLLLLPGVSIERLYPLTAAWCLVPLVWGVWATLAPRTWVPERLPVWGAFLGVIAGLFAAFVLNIPSRVAGEAVSIQLRALLMVVLIILYYALWLLVRLAYRTLTAPSGR